MDNQLDNQQSSHKKQSFKTWINQMNTTQKIGVGLIGFGIIMLPIAYAVTNLNEPKTVVSYHNGQPSIQEHGIAIQRGDVPDLKVENARSYTQNTYTQNTPYAQNPQDHTSYQTQPNYQTPNPQNFSANEYHDDTHSHSHASANCDYYGVAAQVGIKHYKFPEVNASDLVTYSGRHKVHRDVIQPLRDMVAAARADGVNLEVGSAFRSVEYQRGIVERKKKSGQSNAKIYKFSSHPGYSEHHTGFAVDFTPIDHSFAKTKAFGWLKNNASRFGFYQTFTPHYSQMTGVSEESWHWKYTKSPTAQQMLANSNCVGRGQAG